MRKTLLASASAAVLITGLASSASAFEKIHWEWDLDAKTNINVDVDVDIKIDPAGATIVEVDQVFKGDLDAKAVVVGVVNDPLVEYDGKGHWVGWTWYPPQQVAIDAVENLPAVENTAAAIGNAATIESQVSVMADINQSVSDNDWYGGANFNADAAVLGVFNASVENTAQVVGNSASITLDPALTDPSGTTGEVGGGGSCYPFPYPGCGGSGGGNGVDSDNFLMANVNQYANFDGSANALVAGVFISGYDNLGLDTLGRAIVSNTAVAVGNVVSIKVLDGALAED